jgi:L-asparagine oxygenase
LERTFRTGTLVDEEHMEARMPTTINHRVPSVVDATGWVHHSPMARSITDPGLVDEAGAAARLLPAAVHDAFVGFADRPDPSGALLVRGVPIGELPSTPPSPRAATGKDLATEFALLTAARRLGQPVGYAPEHSGHIVQNIVPTTTSVDHQVSTSSKVELMFHTETAFHPHRPRYLLLLCLRGDPSAATTLASLLELLPLIDPATVDVMRQPRFRTAVDASFLNGRSNKLGPPRPLIEGSLDEPTFVFDADLMVGTDDEADRALRTVRGLIETHHTSVVLEPGDLLVVDNHLAVHGRSPFTPRFDGTDRWLQRTFVVSDLGPSAADRSGRVITTVFGE